MLLDERNGAILLVTKDGGWGKIQIGSGDILSVSFQVSKGKEAVERLKTLEEIQFLFQPQRGAVQPTVHADAVIDTQEFFAALGHQVDKQESSTPRRSQRPPPAATPKTPSRREPPPEAGQQQKIRASHKKDLGPKVLVVDDSALARKAARIALERGGYQVIEAKDGFEALGQMQNELPSLVLLDLIMPGLDGYRVLELIRGNQKFKETPVIMLTSRGGLLDKLKGRMSGLDEYLTKPFDADELLKIVNRHLAV